VSVFGDIGGWAGGAWDTLTGQYHASDVPNLQAQPRADQRAAESTLGNWAMTGQGPSAAQDIIENNRAQNAATQIGAAKSMGGDPALANRNAANAIANGNAAATYQGTVLRAQEQQQAMQNYLDSLHATRAQDLGYQGALWGIGQSNAEKEGDAWQNLLKGIGSGGASFITGGGGAGGAGGAAPGAAGGMGAAGQAAGGVAPFI